MSVNKRGLVQAVSALLHNPYLGNFASGTIHRGGTKGLCVPGLNCYSCPGAAGACPIGSLQAVLGGREKSIPYYVAGAILLFGVLFGRLICGFLCPFGFVQDLLHKLPTPSYTVPKRVDRVLRLGKYLALGAVVLLPLLLIDPYGLGTPGFCKYVCPVGILEGAIPLAIASPGIRGALGILFSWKMGILLAILVGAAIICRPFCKYLCPLGAVYGLLNRFSLYQMRVDQAACVGCGKCHTVCCMGVDVTGDINSPECIRCGACKAVCPTCAISSGFGGGGERIDACPTERDREDAAQ